MSSPLRSRRWSLPPLILHPFDDRVDTRHLIETIGCAPAEKAYFEGRYAELRMLCFIGKDINRWLEQCLDFSAAEPAIAALGVAESSFVNLLLFDSPESVVRKLRTWEVSNHQLIFSRALGLNAVYSHPPAAERISERLLREFHHYADSLFDSRSTLSHGAEIASTGFHFELYASGEYARLLEEAWIEPSR